MAEVLVRDARPGEADRLREIAAAAKSHWGYDESLVRGWAAALVVPAEGEEIFVADVDGHTVGWASVIHRDGTCVLDDLWIEPASMGRGIGTLLFARAVERARELGSSTLEWDAEPNAIGFYERVGGRYLRRGEPGEWGRALDVMGVDLS